MAAGGENTLTDRIILELSEKMSVKDMKSIAIKYFGVEIETIKNLETRHREDITCISRDLLVSWRSSHPSENQVQVGDTAQMKIRHFRAKFNSLDDSQNSLLIGFVIVNLMSYHVFDSVSYSEI